MCSTVCSKVQLVQVKQKDLKQIREKLHKDQNNICPIMGCTYPVADMVVDHQHKTRKTDINGVHGAGLIRGCIHRQANVLEGKISNAYVRYGIHHHVSLSDYLRNLADYLDQENLPLIHPTEKEKSPKLMKSSYNKLKKAVADVGEKVKMPDFPKSGKITKPLKKLYDKYKIKPEFYKK